MLIYPPCVRIVVALLVVQTEIKRRVLWELWETRSLRRVFQVLVEMGNNRRHGVFDLFKESLAHSEVLVPSEQLTG